jgi:hypothetical protein
LCLICAVCLPVQGNHTTPSCTYALVNVMKFIFSFSQCVRVRLCLWTEKKGERLEPERDGFMMIRSWGHEGGKYFCYTSYNQENNFGWNADIQNFWQTTTTKKGNDIYSPPHKKIVEVWGHLENYAFNFLYYIAFHCVFFYGCIKKPLRRLRMLRIFMIIDWVTVLNLVFMYCFLFSWKLWTEETQSVVFCFHTRPIKKKKKNMFSLNKVMSQNWSV